MLEKLCTAFIKKSEENFALYEFLEEQNKFIEWQAVAIFYSALCIAKAYLFYKGININSINSHDSIKNWLATESYAKKNNILINYNNLYRHSRDARYITTKKINPTVIQRMLKDYEIVKNVLQNEIN